MGAKKYISLAKVAMQNTIAFRLAFLLTFAANFIGLVAMYCLWQAVYDGQPQIAGFTWQQMETYLVITFFVNSMLSYYSESSITYKVIDGSVMMDLLKPLAFQKARLAESLGSCVLEGGVGAVLIGLFAVVTFSISLPDNGVYAALFLISMVSSIFVKFGIVYCAALLCFWTTSGIGVIWARMAITNLLSGALVPLAFFPDWLRSIAMLLPFQGIVNTPVTIYLGTMPAAEAVRMIGVQWAWIVGLWLLGRWIWVHGVKQITIHGG